MSKTKYIFRILNVKNGKCLIGYSVHPNKIFDKIKQDIRTGKQSTIYNELYEDIYKIGLDWFSFDIIEKCVIDDVNSRKAFWIKFYNSYKNGYNKTEDGRPSFDRSIEVISYDLDGNLVATYPSVKVAVKTLGLKDSAVAGICHVLDCDGLHAHNLQWRRKTKNYPSQITPLAEQRIVKMEENYNDKLKAMKEYFKECDYNLRLVRKKFPSLRDEIDKIAKELSKNPIYRLKMNCDTAIVKIDVITNKISDFYLTQKEAGEKLGQSQANISKRLKRGKPFLPDRRYKLMLYKKYIEEIRKNNN